MARPMIELIQITNDPALARRCDALDGIRVWVDLERNGKAERQAARNTFISAHVLEDVGRVRSVLRRAPLMVRVNPLHDRSPAEVEDVLRQGAQLVMLPMFTSAKELGEFARLLDGRAPLVPLLETAGALGSIDEWVATPGVREVYVGLNDLHLSLGLAFMFEPLAMGLVEHVAQVCRRVRLPFGFGGIARMDEGLVPGRDVLGEHLRLGSSTVILSRTFNREGAETDFEGEVARLRQAERELAARSPAQVEADARRVHAVIRQIADGVR